MPILMACALILPLFLARHDAYKEVMPLIALLPMLFLQPATPPRPIAETIPFSEAIARDTHRPGMAVIAYGIPRVWSLMTGLLLELDRRGIPACTTWKESAPFYTDKEICAEAIPSYGEGLDLLENRSGMHSCFGPKPETPVGAGGKRSIPDGSENTRVRANPPAA